MKRFAKKATVPIFLLLLVAVVWRQTLNQTLQGEGYSYFKYTHNYINEETLANLSYANLNKDDNFGQILANITIPTFKDKLVFYQILQLVIFGLSVVTIYYVVFRLTKQQFLSFIASILILSNFNGNYEMLAEGESWRFMGRVPTLIPIIIAWYLLYRYYKTDKVKSLILSLFLMAIAVFMGHYAALLLPLIIFSAFYFPALIKKDISLIKIIFVIALYLLVTYPIIFRDRDTTKQSFITFFINEPYLAEKVVTQLVAATWPYLIIERLGNFFYLAEPFLPISRLLILPTAVFYLLGGWLVFQKNKKLFPLYCLLFTCTLADIILYLYLDGQRINPLRVFWPGRQFFTTLIYISIITALILQSLLNTKKFFIGILCLIFPIAIFSYNMLIITKYNDLAQYRFDRDKRFIAYMRSISREFTSKTVLITTTPLRFTSYLVARLYAPPGMQFPTTYEQFQSIDPDKEDVIAIDYVHGKNDKGRFTSQGGHILDLTDEYQEGNVDYRDVMGAREK